MIFDGPRKCFEPELVHCSSRTFDLTKIVKYNSTYLVHKKPFVMILMDDGAFHRLELEEAEAFDQMFRQCLQVEDE